MTSGRQYALLRTDIWRDEDWRDLSTDAQWLYEFLISQPVTSTAGVLPLQMTKWARCARDMTTDRVAAAVELLSERRYIVVDYDTEEVLVRSYIRHGAAATGTPNVMLSALRCAVSVQSTELRQALLDEISRLDRQWSDKALEVIFSLKESLCKAFDKPLGKPLQRLPDASVQVQVQVPVVNVTNNKEKQVVSVEVRSLVQGNVDRPLLSNKVTRKGLEEVVAAMLVDDCDPRGIALSLQEWCARPDAYPGHLPHIYTELLKRRNGARGVRDVQGADKTIMVWEQLREQMEDSNAQPG